MTSTPTTLVLLDPTSPDGESALELLTASDDHVALVVLLTGKSSHALRDFARAEEVDLLTAGWIYLDQVVARVGLADRELQTILVDGPSVASEMATLAATMVVRRVLLPTSLDRIDPPAREQLRRSIAAPIASARSSADVNN
jgi:hypothetical protein